MTGVPRQRAARFAYRPGIPAWRTAARLPTTTSWASSEALDEAWRGRLIAHHHAGYGYVGISLLPTHNRSASLLGHRLVAGNRFRPPTHRRSLHACSHQISPRDASSNAIAVISLGGRQANNIMNNNNICNNNIIICNNMHNIII